MATIQANIKKQILETHLYVETKGGLRIKNPATLLVSPAEIEFVKSPFHLKDEIKSMMGSRWNGDFPGKRRPDARPTWTVDNCPRNWFQIKFLMGQNPYEWFDRELIKHEYDYPMMDHQRWLSDTGLTYHFQIWAAEMGTGKTMSAQAVMEMSGVENWYWVGPKKSLENIEREWEKWNFNLSWNKPRNGKDLVESVLANEHNVQLTTYERLVSYMENRGVDDPIPGGIIFDESSRLKSPTAQRSMAAQDLADCMRAKYGHDCYVILMSGTPSPKSPLDWWKQAEIAYPGFLKEGSQDQLQRRLAFMVQQSLPETVINVRVGWKDNEDKCNKCSKLSSDECHHYDDDPTKEVCQFESSINEVAYMYERLNGLVTVFHKKDVLSLPDKVYEIDYCEPSPATIRVAKTLSKSAPNVMTGITWLRELSDGFMYKEVPDGVKQCPTCAESDEAGKVRAWFDPDTPDEPIRAIDMLDEEYTNLLDMRFIECPRCHGSQQVRKVRRVAHEVPCPKEEKLKDRLAQCEETGRIVIFAGFQGSIDRVRGICRKSGWDVVQCDGRGWQVFDKSNGKIAVDKPLNYWADLEHHQQVAFVAHPASGGLSLNLTESRMTVYWSSDFNPESRIQSEARIHRKGMDENVGCKIVDICHLPSDEKILNVLKENRKLELMTMGEITECFEDV